VLTNYFTADYRQNPCEPMGSVTALMSDDVTQHCHKSSRNTEDRLRPLTSWASRQDCQTVESRNARVHRDAGRAHRQRDQHHLSPNPPAPRGHYELRLNCQTVDAARVVAPRPVLEHEAAVPAGRSTQQQHSPPWTAVCPFRAAGGRGDVPRLL
jgi:hypothetical protein